MPRQQGALNKRKREFREALRLYMHSKKVDPHHYMVDLIADTSTEVVVLPDGREVEVPRVSIAHKLQAAKELAQYLEPKLRAVEVSGEGGGALVVNLVRYAAEMDEAEGGDADNSTPA